jgi:hypothetical protein
MRKLFLIFIVLPLLAFAEGNGGYAGAFLRIGLGARNMALGNTGVAGPSDGYAFYYNPAITGFAKGKKISLSYSFMSLDRRFNYVGFTMEAPPAAGFSVGWVNSGVGDLPSVSGIGEFGENIDHSINAAFFNFARRFGEKLSVGLSIKYVWESILAGTDEYFSGGWGWDLGAEYRLNSSVTLAATARDLGTKLKANTDKIFERGGTTIDRFPQLYLLGIQYQTPLNWVTISYDLETSNRSDLENHFGVEASYQKAVVIRAGYYSLGGITFGAGINMRALHPERSGLFGYLGQLDYAFIPSVYDEGSSHVFSWQIFLD